MIYAVSEKVKLPQAYLHPRVVTCHMMLSPTWASTSECIISRPTSVVHPRVVGLTAPPRVVVAPHPPSEPTQAIKLKLKTPQHAGPHSKRGPGTATPVNMINQSIFRPLPYSAKPLTTRWCIRRCRPPPLLKSSLTPLRVPCSKTTGIAIIPLLRAGTPPKKTAPTSLLYLRPFRSFPPTGLQSDACCRRAQLTSLLSTTLPQFHPLRPTSINNRTPPSNISQGTPLTHNAPAHHSFLLHNSAQHARPPRLSPLPAAAASRRRPHPGRCIIAQAQARSLLLH